MDHNVQLGIYEDFEYVVERVINRCHRSLTGDTREEAKQVGKLALWESIPNYLGDDSGCGLNSFLQNNINWAISKWLAYDITGVSTGKYYRLRDQGLFPDIESYDQVTEMAENDDGDSYLDTIHHTTDTPEQALLRTELREILNAGLEVLTRKQRTALVEHVLYEKSLNDIAERDGITVNNQRHIYFTARKAMARYYNAVYNTESALEEV